MLRNFFLVIAFLIPYNIQSQNVGVDKENPAYKLDVNGYSGSDNQISIIPLWQAGSNYTMNNTSGSDFSNVESALDPTAYDANGDIEVKLVIRITSTSTSTPADIVNFQLRTHDGLTEAFPIVNTDGWIFSQVQTGFIAASPWKDWAAGTKLHELHLFGWLADPGFTNFNCVYLMVRPNR